MGVCVWLVDVRISGLHLPEFRSLGLSRPEATAHARGRSRPAFPGPTTPEIPRACLPPARCDRPFQALRLSAGGARSALQAASAPAAGSAGRVAVRGC